MSTSRGRKGVFVGEERISFQDFNARVNRCAA